MWIMANRTGAAGDGSVNILLGELTDLVLMTAVAGVLVRVRAGGYESEVGFDLMANHARRIILRYVSPEPIIDDSVTLTAAFHRRFRRRRIGKCRVAFQAAFPFVSSVEFVK